MEDGIDRINDHSLHNPLEKTPINDDVCGSLLYHMEKKYLCDQGVESFIEGVDIFGTSPCKVANKKGLELLVLDRCNITDNVGDVDRLSAFVRNVAELDLSWNSIKSWSTVATLLSAMPALKLLNLSHNPIGQSEPLVDAEPSTSSTAWDCTINADERNQQRYSSRSHYQRRNSTGEMEENSRDSCCQLNPSSSSCDDVLFQAGIDNGDENTYSITGGPSIPTCHKLSTLILNGVQLPLRSVRRFIGAMPSLQEIHMAENRFDMADMCKLFDNYDNRVTPFSESVKVLNLNGCKIDNWNVVLQFLKLFPNTVYLFAAENRISHIDFNDSRLNTKQVSLPICSLVLSGNEISTWASIENLSQIRWLEELRIRNIPLLNGYSEEERRHLVVGRLRSLRCLNGSVITESQREDSERFFIRFYQNSSERPWIYDELVAHHGHVEQLVKVDLTPRRFAKVRLRCDETNYSAQVRIRLSCSVLELMRHAEKMTGISVGRMRLFYSYSNTGNGAELRFPNRALSSLHIEDGDEFFIQSKILPSKQMPTKRHAD